jgi:hypothetical protein
MNLGKALAAAFCAGVVGAQAFAVLRPPRAGRYWPFLNYPMYDEAHWQGEQMSQLKLLVVPCDSAQARAVSSNDIHLTQFVFRDLLFRGATAPPRRADRAAELLRQQLRYHEPHPTCRMEIHLKSYTVGPHGLELPGPPWRLARAWTLTDSAAVPARDSPTIGTWR